MRENLMLAAQFSEGYLLRLERDEEVTESLTRFLEEKEIRAGIVSGLGGIADAELGFYDLPTKTYLRRVIPGNLELVHYLGNITQVDGKPFIHAHAVVSGRDYQAYSGHFFQARIAVTGEFVIRPADWKVSRALDDFTGLKLMDLGDPRLRGVK
jgi:predicted DNA-binding protein with PD1-like motif